MMRRIPRLELNVAPRALFAVAGVAGVAGVDPKLERTLAYHAAHAQALSNAQSDIIEITQRAVAALLQAELTLSPEHIRKVVQQLVQEVRAARQITLHLHPADRALMPSEQELAEQAEAQGAIEIVTDPALLRGDCVLTSDLGDIDARIATKLAHLQELLLQHTQAPA